MHIWGKEKEGKVRKDLNSHGIWNKKKKEVILKKESSITM